MLMMRLQRVGRKNDPSFRIVVTDKRTGPKSDKHIDRLGSYNPKMNQIQIDVEKAKEWLAKGVQPSDTVHNILVGQKVIEGKKRNVLPRKSPIIDEEAIKRAEAEAKAKAEAAEKAKADAAAAAIAAIEVDIVADTESPEVVPVPTEAQVEEVAAEEDAHTEALTDAEDD
jgi:small subunit ribosomal protein S16